MKDPTIGVVFGNVTFMRLVAIGMLIVSAMSFVAFDLHAAEFGPQQTRSDEDCGSPTGDADCVACCAHVVPSIPSTIFVQFEQVSLVEVLEPQATTRSRD